MIGTATVLAVPPLIVRVSVTDVFALLLIRFVVQLSILGIPRTKLGSRSGRTSRSKAVVSILAGAAFACYLLCFFASIQQTSVDRAILLSSQYFAVILAIRVILRKQVTAREFAGSALVATGLVAALTGTGGGVTSGDWLGGAAAILFACYLLASERRLNQDSWAEAVDHQLVVAGTGSALLAVLVLLRWLGGEPPSVAAVWGGVALGLLGVAGHVGLSKVQAGLGLSSASFTAVASPLIAGALGALLFRSDRLVQALAGLLLASIGFAIAYIGVDSRRRLG